MENELSHQAIVDSIEKHFELIEDYNKNPDRREDIESQVITNCGIYRNSEIDAAINEVVLKQPQRAEEFYGHVTRLRRFFDGLVATRNDRRAEQRLEELKKQKESECQTK